MIVVKDYFVEILYPPFSKFVPGIIGMCVNIHVECLLTSIIKELGVFGLILVRLLFSCLASEGEVSVTTRTAGMLVF